MVEARKAGLINYHQGLNSRQIFVLIFFIIIALIVDTSIVKISAFTGGLSSVSSGIVIFAGMTMIFCIGQYLILGYVRKTNQEHHLYESLPLNLLAKGISIIQYVLIAILVTLILQMVFTSSYNVFLLQLAVWISYSVAIVLLVVLCQRFLSWFKSNHSVVVLAYALAIMMICINAIFTIFYVTNQVSGAHSEPMIHPALTPVANYDKYSDILDAVYVVTSILSFILTWVATVILLHSYSSKFGRAKYWILVSIPLVYFLSQFQFIFIDVFTYLRISDPILFGVVYTLFFDATIPVGGALFGIAFWSVARNIRHITVKRYMMISAYGIMLLYSSNQASGLTVVAYPPFGLVSVSFLGVAAFLIFIGIYSSAISVAQDSQLRKSIRGLALQESKLLDSIGSAQMERAIEKRVIDLTKRNQDKMIKETRIESSLSEDDMKQYLDQVIEEVQNQKTRPGSE